MRLAHTVLGIGTAAVLILVAASGTLLVFQPELEAALGPDVDWDGTETAPWSAVRERAEAARPEHRLQMLWFPNRSRPFYTAAYAIDGREYTDALSFHPVTGEAIAHEPSVVFPWLEELHENLHLGDVGAFLVRWSTALLAILLLTGLWVGWPGRGRPGLLTIRPGRPWLLDTHRAAGVVAAPCLLAMLWTGCVWAFPTTLEPWIYAVSGETAPEAEGELWQLESRLPAASTPPRDADPQAMLDQAHAETPNDAFVYYLSFPIYPTENRQVRMQRGYSPWPGGEVSVFYFDRYSGALLGSQQAAAGPASLYLARWNAALHFGTFGGWPTRALWAAASAVLVYLAVTGPWLWWRRR